MRKVFLNQWVTRNFRGLFQFIEKIGDTQRLKPGYRRGVRGTTKSRVVPDGRRDSVVFFALFGGDVLVRR